MKKTIYTGTLFNNQQLKTLIFPLVIEQILAVMVGMVDTMMISYAGEAAISGVSLVDMINNLLINIFAAIATGGAVIISQYIGRKDQKKACESANQLLLITGLISIMIALLIILTRHPLLRLLFGSITDEVMSSAQTYLLISAYSYPFLALFNSCAAVFRSMGNSKTAMQVSIGMNICNAIGNAILIFGFGMGVAGAALSSLFARALAACVMFLLIQNKKQYVYILPRQILHFDWNLIHKIVYIALPNGIENGLFQLGRVLVVSIIAGFGTVQIAANAVANSLDSVGCIAGQAMNLAMLTVIGQCMGAGDAKQADYYTKKLLKITYALTIGINAVLLSSLPIILNVYTLSPEARQLSYILVFIHNGCAMLLWPVSFTLSNALRAAGDVKFTMIIAIFSMFAFRILFSIILGTYFGMGAIGVWIAMVLDWIFRASIFITRFIRGKWKAIRII